MGCGAKWPNRTAAIGAEFTSASTHLREAGELSRRNLLEDAGRITGEVARVVEAMRGETDRVRDQIGETAKSARRRTHRRDRSLRGEFRRGARAHGL